MRLHDYRHSIKLQVTNLGFLPIYDAVVVSLF